MEQEQGLHARINLLLIKSSLCTGLLCHESNAALAGGVNIMLMAKTTASVCQLQALSVVGRCRTFDSRSARHMRNVGYILASHVILMLGVTLHGHKLAERPLCLGEHTRVNIGVYTGLFPVTVVMAMDVARALQPLCYVARRQVGKRTSSYGALPSTKTAGPAV